MNSWLAWIVFAVVAVVLGAVGYHFSLRTLRWVAFIVALATAVYLTVYGLTHPAQKPGSLSDAFARGADTLSSALIRPLSLGHHVPVPGRIGWLVIVVLLVLGYRGLEAWTLLRQAPCLDVSALTSDRQDDAADAGTDAADRQAAARVARRGAQVPAARGGGALAGHPARRQQAQRAGVDRRGHRRNRSGAGRGDHPVLRDGVAEPAPDPGPGLGGTDPGPGEYR